MARAALGKGLSALIREPEPPPVQTTEPKPAGSEQQIDIDLIDPNPYQPRTRFAEEPLEELAQSIRASGIIQPLILRARGARFQLIAGERRWRAAQRAGLQRVPAILRDVPEELALQITLVENLQREDLNAIEQAKAFDRLISEFHLTQEQIAERTGKDRATVANAVRLLKLEQPIQELIELGKITAGHGRALLAVQDLRLRLALARRAARGGINVRQIERLAVRRTMAQPLTPTKPSDPNIQAAIEELQKVLGTRVLLRPCTSKRPGALLIEYYDDRQLIDLYERIVVA